MPIYAYRCESCGFEKDALQKLSDAPLTDCPECGQPTLKKQVTAAGFQLKGSGWYVTDFRDGGNKQKAGDKPAAPSGDAKPADAGASTSEGVKPAADKSASSGDAKAAPAAPAAAPAASTGSGGGASGGSGGSSAAGSTSSSGSGSTSGSKSSGSGSSS